MYFRLLNFRYENICLIICIYCINNCLVCVCDAVDKRAYYLPLTTCHLAAAFFLESGRASLSKSPGWLGIHFNVLCQCLMLEIWDLLLCLYNKKYEK